MISNQPEIGLQRTRNKMNSIIALNVTQLDIPFPYQHLENYLLTNFFSDEIPYNDFILRQI